MAPEAPRILGRRRRRQPRHVRGLAARDPGRRRGRRRPRGPGAGARAALRAVRAGHPHARHGRLRAGVAAAPRAAGGGHAHRHELQALVEEARRENRQLQAQLQDFIHQQEVLRQQATHDTLTHLPNRALFEDRLAAAVARSRRNRQRFALAYLDLDGFKEVNDAHGHATGDALLVAVARRLQDQVRATDTVARLGGDEFALLFEALDSAAGAAYVAEKVHAALVRPLAVRPDPERPEFELRPGASVGLAIYPDHAPSAEELIAHADAAMYAVKRRGGGVRVYSGEADVPRAERAHLQLVRGRRP